MVIAFGRLDNQAHVDGLGGYFNPYDTAIYEGSDLLNIDFELPFTSAGYLATDAAKVFSSASVDLGTGGAGLFSCKKAHSGHDYSCLEGLANGARLGLESKLIRQMGDGIKGKIRLRAPPGACHVCR